MVHTIQLFTTLMICLWGVLGTPDTGARAATLGSMEDAGVRVEFHAQPETGTDIQAGADIRMRFRITDSQSGEGVSQLKPAAWVTLRKPGQDAPGAEACEQKIASLLQKGLVRTQAEADLNSFFLLTLNADNSVGIIDPTVNLRTANLLALIPFEGRPADWTLAPETGMVYVTLPAEGRVALIDADLRKLRGYLETGKGARRVELQPDGRYLWVGNDRAGTVSAIDTATHQVAQTFDVGDGPIDLAVDDTGRLAFAAAAGGRVTVIDVATLQTVGRIDTAPGELRLAYSPLSEALYAGRVATGELLVIDPAQHRIINRIDLRAPLGPVVVTPDGRQVLALAPEQRRLQVIDTATNRMTGEVATETQPDQVIFTPQYAYVRNRGAPNVTVIQLQGLENPATASVVNIPFGVVPPGSVETLPGVDTLAAFPHGGHILTINPADRTVYLYMEGMLAPMNSFKTYTSPPLGMLFYDRSLREGTTAGDYSATVRLEEPGTYDVPIYLGSPLVAACFALTVPEDPERARSRPPQPVFADRFADAVFRPQEPAVLRFTLTDARTGKPLADIKDLTVMSFQRSGHWQHRTAPRDLGEGLYEAQFTLPREGRYLVLVEAPSLGIRFGDLPAGVVTVTSQGQSPQ